MSDGIPWPPVSPRAALLSSPSGRRKYEAYQSSYSPVKRTASTPNLLDQLRAARKDKEFSSQDENMEEEIEEDEETLQLKLAAIEAKLKLKKLQQNKARAATPGRVSSQSSSAHGFDSAVSKPHARHQEPLPEPAKVEVKGSPVRRAQPSVQPRSPSRVLLGIDKGMRGSDISLRRANTTAGASRTRTEFPVVGGDRPSSRSSAFSSARSALTTKSTFNDRSGGKTFSERMAEARERTKTSEQRRETISRNRSKGLELDQAELEKYRLAAEESRSREPPRSPRRMTQHEAYSREDILKAAKEATTKTRLLEKKQTKSNHNAPLSRPSPRDSDTAVPGQADSSLFERFSQLHLTSRILPHSFLKRTLPSDKFTVLRVPDLLRQVKSPDFDLPETICDYVVCGVIASKSSPMDQKAPPPDGSTVGTKDWERQWEDGSKNQRRFMALTITDLKWTVDLYLFGTALPRYHRLTPGTVVAILNPGIMPPKHGKTDTGAFSLSLNSGDDTVLEIGTARDLGYCKTVKKDGKECGSWVDASKTEICEWHLNAELNKTRATRMGVNTGTNGFGGTGAGSHRFFDRTRAFSNQRNNELLPKDGHRYNKFTGSHFYIARSNTGPTAGGRRTAGGGGGLGFGLDDDPFIPARELERDRDERLRKHFATQEKEREIAEKLGAGCHAGSGDAGAAYLRHKANKSRAGPGEDSRGSGPSENTAGDSSLSHNDIPFSRGAILSHDIKDAMATGTGGGISRKRTAADVRLSPVKKTRFVTSRGIKEAGRESLGASVAAAAAMSASDSRKAHARGDVSGSEDDLEIV
ncbi:hypothetical protein A1O1_05001 [Capronia coronata CBS 617.96]|uniref:Uncharacterized protein n=1 Tax=Capronia coronata CBS 617.96 TaxID=1182541 RepID=W9Y6B1_9EURO|nr:uncharacterized protein A1O1_05001 [Capronia coronata CBS 617.96]EXJ88073.1 hypothetical protein A1O1_05001 [Capronia coronata CBS 617.96]